ncbi:hypothetical protein CEXT_730461 [Caerostris extrusa]|uniref:Uncharacterized protein n=1 Tax=Caerostris extrusa TaxID=172846 RepID=A0AAV4NCS0_CAEEX|nr:hypothetical protein CEXT_730461 [Caerostris extrusa]
MSSPSLLRSHPILNPPTCGRERSTLFFPLLLLVMKGGGEEDHHNKKKKKKEQWGERRKKTPHLNSGRG